MEAEHLGLGPPEPLIFSGTHHLIINFTEPQMSQLLNRDDNINLRHRACTKLKEDKLLKST